MPELAILIPSRNEMFTSNTVQDILAHIEADTEIVVVLDGWFTPLESHPKLKVIHNVESAGQRAATNQAADSCDSKYIMKVDAHCSFDQGFDRKLLELMAPDITMVPIMRNLHAFDWVCPVGHRRYQGPSGPCKHKDKDKECGEPTHMDIAWYGKPNPQSTSYCFDTQPHFQYFQDYKKRLEFKNSKPLTETMSLQGSAFLLTRDKYYELNACGEDFGSWGSQGLEVAIKTWLSGGRVLCNHNTWYAHMFRTQGGDFGFPYELSGRQVQSAKKHAANLFFTNSWDKQIYPLSWLIEKFNPVPGWHYALGSGRRAIEHHPEVMEQVMEAGRKFNKAPAIIKKSNKGLIYYSDLRPNDQILQSCQNQIMNCANGHDIVSVTLKPISFGRNFYMNLERGYLTMFKQILKGIEESRADILFLVEHDCLYLPCHFDFIPPDDETFYYDENKWHVDYFTGHALFYNHMSVSALCAKRDLLLKHYIARVEKVEKEGFTRRFGFEPGSHKIPRGCDNYGRKAYWAKYPFLDIRHDRNVTSNRWRKDQFRNQKQLYAWEERKVWELPGWDINILRKAFPEIKM